MLVTNLNKVRGLSPKYRRLLFQSVLLLPCIHVALIFLGYIRLRRVMEKLIPSKTIVGPPSDSEGIQRAQEIARIVSIAAQHGLYKATCLRKSLLTWGFLRREQLAAKLCFGVRMSHQKLEAHAWVEYNGIVLNESENVHERYQALQDTFPETKLGL